MPSRPQILFPLFGQLTQFSGIGPKIALNLSKLDINSPRDLLFNLPYSLLTRNKVDTVFGKANNDIVIVEITVDEHVENLQKNRPYKINVSDAKTSFQLVFFHSNKNWLRDLFPIGDKVLISGKLEYFEGRAQITHPDYVLKPGDEVQVPLVEPLYSLSAGITQKTISKAARQALKLVPGLNEWISPSIINKYAWPSWVEALQDSHLPKNINQINSDSINRLRLAYDELLAHQLTLAIARENYRKSKGIKNIGNGILSSKVIKLLPFDLTNAQIRVIDEIRDDMSQPFRMNRLLQGDVGSGKTLIAFLCMLSAIEAGGQAVIMAPTEILTKQHEDTLKPLAAKAGIILESLSGRDKGKERKFKIEAIAAGKIQIIIGTHAVFQESIKYNDLRLAIIDEQHRFGVRQRMDLGNKGNAVDILVMTATPIPRSLALTNYGDMELSELDEKPIGRKPINTVMVSSSRIFEVIERLKAAIKTGNQIYWVCPLVEDSEFLELTSAEDRANKLSKVLGRDNVGLVHGKMPAEEKDKVMLDFINNKIKILVATTVIEVGVDVPNATIIVIEHSERFGLSQLHQLRGRVGRGSDASTCLMLYKPPLGKTAKKRLEAIRETNDGFKIANVDLKLRGAGDVLGVAQSGLPKFRIANIEVHSNLMELAKDEARLVMAKDPTLTSPQGKALRNLLYIMGADQSIKLLSVG